MCIHAHVPIALSNLHTRLTNAYLHILYRQCETHEYVVSPSRELAQAYFFERTGVDVTDPTFLAPMSTRGAVLRMLHNLLKIYADDLTGKSDETIKVVPALCSTLHSRNGWMRARFQRQIMCPCMDRMW